MINSEYLLDEEEQAKDCSLPSIEIEFTGIVRDYDPAYCKAIIEHCTQGGSVESFAGIEHIDPDALISWIQHEDFKSSAKIAISAEYNYWECQLKEALVSDDFAFRLPSINRKLAELGSTLLKNGLRNSMYKYVEPERETEETQELKHLMNEFAKK